MWKGNGVFLPRLRGNFIAVKNNRKQLCAKMLCALEAIFNKRTEPQYCTVPSSQMLRQCRVRGYKRCALLSNKRRHGASVKGRCGKGTMQSKLMVQKVPTASAHAAAQKCAMSCAKVESNARHHFARTRWCLPLSLPVEMHPQTRHS